jgi:hypothetical protein
MTASPFDLAQGREDDSFAFVVDVGAGLGGFGVPGGGQRAGFAGGPGAVGMGAGLRTLDVFQSQVRQVVDRCGWLDVVGRETREQLLGLLVRERVEGANADPSALVASLR